MIDSRASVSKPARQSHLDLVAQNCCNQFIKSTRASKGKKISFMDLAIKIIGAKIFIGMGEQRSQQLSVKSVVSRTAQKLKQLGHKQLQSILLSHRNQINQSLDRTIKLLYLAENKTSKLHVSSLVPKISKSNLLLQKYQQGKII